ncbi:hypothetical protein J6590_051404 [Homalodisca vitripennis]|nr:hypothetical protein J6590_051404 [Homalodisca vitripennis]
MRYLHHRNCRGSRPSGTLLAATLATLVGFLVGLMKSYQARSDERTVEQLKITGAVGCSMDEPSMFNALVQEAWTRRSPLMFREHNALPRTCVNHAVSPVADQRKPSRPRSVVQTSPFNITSPPINYCWPTATWTAA